MHLHILSLSAATIMATLSACLLAADVAVETFWTGAERWGLWAALTLVLVLSVLYGLYRIVNFVLTTMVELLAKTNRAIRRCADAFENAPCGVKWDSDEEADEMIDAVGRAAQTVRRRQRRAEKNAEPK